MNGRRYLPLVFSAVVAFTFYCAGCEKSGEPGEIEKVSFLIKDPKNLAYAFASLTGIVAFLLWFFSGRGLWDALLNGVRYTSLIASVLAPLYALMLDPSFATSLRAGIAMEISGLIGIGITSFLLWEHRRDIRAKKAASSDDKVV